MASKKAEIIKKQNYLKWEKQKVDKQVNQLILSQAIPLTQTLIAIAIEDRNPNAINSLLDRAFGKARQNIGLDGGAEDKPIVFLPSTLMTKYAIQAGSYKELKSPGDKAGDEPAGVLIEPHESNERAIESK